MRKWLSYRKNHTIVRVAKSKKRGAAVEKCNVFFFEIPRKNDQQSSKKVRKTEIHQKTDKKTDLGTTFLGKRRILGDFAVPGRSLGKALGRILGGKFGGGKNDEKKVVSVVALAGAADPARRDLGRIRARGAGSNTPPLILRMGGRIVYASRIPPRPHEALRLGGFEEGTGRCLEKSRNL